MTPGSTFTRGQRNSILQDTGNGLLGVKPGSSLFSGAVGIKYAACWSLSEMTNRSGVKRAFVAARKVENG